MSDDSSADPRSPPVRARRWPLPLAVAVLLLLAVATRGAGRGSPEAAPTPAADWVEVMRGLDARRSAAFATGEPERLREVYAPACACLAIDTRLLRERGPVRGLRHEVISARAVEEAPGRVTLFVVDRMPPARAEAAWTVELVLTPAGWRIESLAAA